MPRKPKSPCNSPGCGALVEGGGHCPACRRKYQQRQDKERGTAHQRGYTVRWRRASKRFLREHPLCECDECRRLNRIRASTVVDHKIPHRGDYDLFWDETNWQAMAKDCHDRKTAREDGGFGNRTRA
ncbi:MAG: HNH endonuclease [Clostridia bacterium]|nr:HNH endonuclease [Clostridia bacterium]